MKDFNPPPVVPTTTHTTTADIPATGPLVHDPPDRIAALTEAGDALAEAVDYMLECRMDMSRITHAYDKLRAALTAWRKARGA